MQRTCMQLANFYQNEYRYLTVISSGVPRILEWEGRGSRCRRRRGGGEWAGEGSGAGAVPLPSVPSPQKSFRIFLLKIPYLTLSDTFIS